MRVCTSPVIEDDVTDCSLLNNSLRAVMCPLLAAQCTGVSLLLFSANILELNDNYMRRKFLKAFRKFCKVSKKFTSVIQKSLKFLMVSKN